MERRRWPGTRIECSRLGWRVSSKELSRPSWLAPTLARSWERGVDLLDASPLAGNPAHEARLWSALPRGPAWGRVLVGRTLGEGGGSERADRSLEGLRDRLPPGWEIWVALGNRDRHTAPTESEIDRIASLVADGHLDGWGWSEPVGSDVPPGRPDPGFAIASFSWSEPPPEPPRSRERTAWIASDLGAEGLRHGTELAGPLRLSPGAPGGGPTPLRELRRELDPILALQGLVVPHRRTLAQAALQWASSHPEWDAILFPLPAPERLEEILSFERTPAWSEADQAVVELVYGPRLGSEAGGLRPRNSR